MTFNLTPGGLYVLRMEFSSQIKILHQTREELLSKNNNWTHIVENGAIVIWLESTMLENNLFHKVLFKDKVGWIGGHSTSFTPIQETT